MNTEQKCCELCIERFSKRKYAHVTRCKNRTCPCHHTEQKGWRERFNQEFVFKPSDKTKSGLQLDCDPEFAKAFIERTLQEETKKAELRGIERGQALERKENEIIRKEQLEQIVRTAALNKDTPPLKAKE